MRKWNDLGGARGAGRLRQTGKEQWVPHVSRAGQDEVGLSDRASRAGGCSVRGRLFAICIYTGLTIAGSLLGVQRSCVPGPEEGVCGYRLQLQTVSAQRVGGKQAHISCPLLGLSPCRQSLVFSTSIFLLLAFLCHVFKSSCSCIYPEIAVKQK